MPSGTRGGANFSSRRSQPLGFAPHRRAPPLGLASLSLLVLLLIIIKLPFEKRMSWLSEASPSVPSCAEQNPPLFASSSSLFFITQLQLLLRKASGQKKMFVPQIVFIYIYMYIYIYIYYKNVSLFFKLFFYLKGGRFSSKKRGASLTHPPYLII